MSTQRDVTPQFDWRAVLIRKLDQLRCAETMLGRTADDEEVAVLIVAIVSIEESAARAIKNLGGLASPW